MPALIFDCDGVLADTERDGHLPAFNQTFREFAVPVRWSDSDYAVKVRIGGGKERMRSAVTPAVAAVIGLPDDPGALDEAVARWHRRKTAIYTDAVARGALPGRPGIRRITADADAAGWTLAVASTSAEASVRAVLTEAVGPDLAAHFRVFAGDIVAAKKPAPDIYLLALRELGVPAAEALVIEDSANGLQAALAAGLRTLITVSGYTAAEDFTGASLVVTSLGDPGGPTAITLKDPLRLDVGRTVELTDLTAILAAPGPITPGPTSPEPETP
ncbi:MULTISPECIES: HAD-IA family hydrolase [unclassified Cryobacterium]|uniref:HAD-IA family hydrolase n=1 Tax=unclassified Cryobacterium TaxID=2649013 RepID=UPI001069AD45|nr:MULTISPECIES: HAD-IA family hydrolase [unclassified Cryobacterium]TFC00615.1 HAD family hydrolase [Cryobacterium sp. MDB2-A-1]TFC09393.1 HAD family hydrolase [Cryobacterium sp. MDB2-A-2]TFC15073.1 HAD family hydrolase [Cryobacterium sp. MDB2-10]